MTNVESIDYITEAMSNSYRQKLSEAKTVLYRRPKEEFARMIRWGPRAYFLCDRWMKEMEAAAWTLPVPSRKSKVESRKFDLNDAERKSSNATPGGCTALREQSTVKVAESNSDTATSLTPSTDSTSVPAANCKLPTVNISPSPVSLWFLTGKRFWYQTAFCAWTFAKQSGRDVILNLVDDGSLTSEHESGLRRLFPQGGTVHKSDLKERIDTLLPVDRFPILRQRWVDYINIRKLTDIHLGSTGVKLVLDSDMLFFRKPQAILDWWDSAQSAAVGSSQSSEVSCQSVPAPICQYPAPNSKLPAISPQISPKTRQDSEFPPLPTANCQLPTSTYSPLLMTDCEESYGYSRPLMERLSGAPIPPLLNVGICGLRSECLDWEELEFWCRSFLEQEGTSYYLEQALVAMHAAKNPPVVLHRTEYITFPTKKQTLSSSGVLQHYVADSKPWYFAQGWKVAL